MPIPPSPTPVKLTGSPLSYVRQSIRIIAEGILDLSECPELSFDECIVEIEVCGSEEENVLLPMSGGFRISASKGTVIVLKGWRFSTKQAFSIVCHDACSLALVECRLSSEEEIAIGQHHGKGIEFLRCEIGPASKIRVFNGGIRFRECRFSDSILRVSGADPVTFTGCTAQMAHIYCFDCEGVVIVGSVLGTLRCKYVKLTTVLNTEFSSRYARPYTEAIGTCGLEVDVGKCALDGVRVDNVRVILSWAECEFTSCILDSDGLFAGERIKFEAKDSVFMLSEQSDAWRKPPGKSPTSIYFLSEKFSFERCLVLSKLPASPVRDLSKWLPAAHDSVFFDVGEQRVLWVKIAENAIHALDYSDVPLDKQHLESLVATIRGMIAAKSPPAQIYQRVLSEVGIASEN